MAAVSIQWHGASRLAPVTAAASPDTARLLPHPGPHVPAAAGPALPWSRTILCGYVKNRPWSARSRPGVAQHTMGWTGRRRA